MARSHFALLLLLNYLLVVGVGFVDRPTRVLDRPFDYVHAPDCQVRHTLRLACFDDCNGVQYKVEKHGERPPLTQLLTTLKGLDLHCLPSAHLALVVPSYRRSLPRHVLHEVAVSVGYRGEVDLPPRRG